MLTVKRAVEPNIFYKGEAFHLAAVALSDMNELEGRGGPFIVNAMFSLELYLKSVLGATKFAEPSEYCIDVTIYNKVYSESKKGHVLSKLYLSIDAELKKEIDSAYDIEGEKISICEFFDKYQSHFVDWRYSFEGNAKEYNKKEILDVLHVINVSLKKRVEVLTSACT